MFELGWFTWFLIFYLLEMLHSQSHICESEIGVTAEIFENMVALGM